MNLSLHDSLDRASFESILEIQANWYLSIYLPMHRHGSETRENPIKFKNQIQEVQENFSDREVRQVFDTILDDHDFWQNQQDGLALLGTPDEFQLFTLPTTFPTAALYNNHFLVRPLLPYLQDNGSFLVLTLAKDAIHLWLGSHYQKLEEIPLPDVPTSFEEYLDSFDIKQEIQFRSGKFGTGGNTALFHGHGDTTIAEKAEIRKFFSHFQTDISSLLKEYDLPLVVVGLDSLLSIFMETCDYKKCLHPGIYHQPEGLSLKELQQKAWEIVGPVYQESQNTARQKIADQQHTDLVTHELAKALQDAYQGKIETLLVSPLGQRWGEFNPNTNTVKFHTDRLENSEDLVELATQWTLKRGGEVYLEEDLSELVTAQLRY